MGKCGWRKGTSWQIFTGDESDLARNLDREAVLEYLKAEAAEAVVPYLVSGECPLGTPVWRRIKTTREDRDRRRLQEHCVYKWEDDRPRMHETLLEYYVIKVKTLLKEYTHVFSDGGCGHRLAGDAGHLRLVSYEL